MTEQEKYIILLCCVVVFAVFMLTAMIAYIAVMQESIKSIEQQISDLNCRYTTGYQVQETKQRDIESNLSRLQGLVEYFIKGGWK